MNDQFRMKDNAGKSQKASVTFAREVIEDDSPDLSYLEQDYADCGEEEVAKYREQDKERLAAYWRGDWHMTGIRAKAVIMVPCGGGSFATYTLTSPGLWGVESDCGEEYLNEVYEEEVAQLKDAMKAIGEVA